MDNNTGTFTILAADGRGHIVFEALVGPEPEDSDDPTS